MKTLYESIFDEENINKSIDNIVTEAKYIKIADQLRKMFFYRKRNNYDEDALGNKIEKGDLVYKFDGPSYDRGYFALAFGYYDGINGKLLRAIRGLKSDPKNLSPDPKADNYWCDYEYIDVIRERADKFLLVCKFKDLNSKVINEYK